MRLDKYLKVSRLIKRRTVANEACDNERVTVNGRVARASYDVKVGDVITIRGRGDILYRIRKEARTAAKVSASTRKHFFLRRADIQPRTASALRPESSNSWRSRLELTRMSMEGEGVSTNGRSDTS